MTWIDVLVQADAFKGLYKAGSPPLTDLSLSGYTLQGTNGEFSFACAFAQFPDFPRKGFAGKTTLSASFALSGLASFKAEGWMRSPIVTARIERVEDSGLVLVELANDHVFIEATGSFLRMVKLLPY